MRPQMHREVVLILHESLQEIAAGDLFLSVSIGNSLLHWYHMSQNGVIPVNPRLPNPLKEGCDPEPHDWSSICVTRTSLRRTILANYTGDWWHHPQNQTQLYHHPLMNCFGHKREFMSKILHILLQGHIYCEGSDTPNVMLVIPWSYTGSPGFDHQSNYIFDTSVVSATWCEHGITREHQQGKGE